MPLSEKQIVLVTPVWNDCKRLELFGPKLAQALSKSDLTVRWIVADDGSSKLEQAKITALVECLSVVYADVEVMLFAERSRKGGAIYQAWSACPDADLLAFVDADGAVDAPSTLRLLRHACQCDPNVGVVGVRHNAVDTPVQRPWQRLLCFRMFTKLVRGLVGIEFEDTQCGAKVIPAAAYRALSTQLVERGFVFDVELLVALEAQGSRIEELRIPWREMPGGRVKPLRDAWGMIAGLLRIRKRLKANLY
ncbi:MAG: glycosyltransferase [Opitutae bacterium]|nr:glycosyltransferase [Opitutae bacterium]MDG1300517.1 glycosyltransferase [Opitutae bacterium]